jgi:hypothetical protein
VKRLLFLLVLAVGLMLTACDAADSSGERAGKERRPDKAAKVERPRSESDAKKEAKQFDRESQPSPAEVQYSSPSAAAAQYSSADADSSSGPSPEDVVASQYRHINSGQYGAAYDLFDDQSLRAIPGRHG